MKAVALLLFVAGIACAAPSKQAESDSVDTAHRELERLTGLTTQKQYDRFLCEFWFYESLDDPADFARLKEDEKKALRKLIGDRSFFLHRFTPKKKGPQVFEVLVGNDGRTILGHQKKPNKSPEPTPGSVTPRADARVAPAPVVAHL